MSLEAKLDELTSKQPRKTFSGNKKLITDVANIANVATFDIDEAVDLAEEKKRTAIAEIEKALAVCAENPGALMSPAFVDAVKTIRADQQQWAYWRVKIKAAKPSGVPLSDIDKATRPEGFNDDGNDSVPSELISLVTEQGELFFDDQADSSYVSVSIDGVIHTLAIGSKNFVDWLSFSYYNATKRGSEPGKSASEAAIKQACFALSGIAKHEGGRQRVFLRTAGHNGGYYVFLGDDGLHVAEVLATGWRILDYSPVKFWKPSSAQSLPMPQVGGNLSKLWEFVNIPEHDRLLVLAWMLEAFRADTPFPILALSGPQGSAKSSTGNKLRQLIDNNAVNLRSAPKSIEDVFVSAGCNWLACFENISHLSPAMQDALCTLATGGGYAARTLYTNKEESIIEAKRPVMINSIPNVITAQDAVDRTINVELPRIEYREESEINAAWELAKPAIFGGLLDLFVKTLAQLPRVKLINPPRMADFTRLGEAMAQALGNPPGVFDSLYKVNRSESVGRALESSPVAVAVCEMVDKHNGRSATVFYGTVNTLLIELANHRHDAESWPRSARGLGDILKRQAPALEAYGIRVISGNKPERIGGNRGIPVEIRKDGNIGNVGNVVSEFSVQKKNYPPNISGISDDVERF